MANIQNINYTFNPSAKTIKFNTPIDIFKLQSISANNVNTHIYILGGGNGLGGSFNPETNTLTLEYDTTSLPSNTLLSINLNEDLSTIDGGFSENNISSNYWKEASINGVQMQEFSPIGSEKYWGIPDSQTLVYFNKGVPFISHDVEKNDTVRMLSSLTTAPECDLSVASSLSQRTLGEQHSFGLVEVNDNGNVNSLPAKPEFAITSIVGISTSNRFTITLNIPTGQINPYQTGDLIEIVGGDDNRLIGGSYQIIATSFTTTLPSNQIEVSAFVAVVGTFSPVNARIRHALPNLFAKNSAGVCHEGSSATAGSSLFSNGDSNDLTYTRNQSITTTGVIPTNFANGISFLPSEKVFLNFFKESAIFLKYGINNLASGTSLASIDVNYPNNSKKYAPYIFSKSLEARNRVVAKIVSIAKTGTTTARVTTSAPHGLTSETRIIITGVRDITNFPHLSTPITPTIIDSTTFDVVIGTASTTNSYGGVVIVANSNTNSMTGVNNLSVNNIQRNSINEIVFTMNTTVPASTVVAGEIIQLSGGMNSVDDTSYALDGKFIVLRQTGTTIVAKALNKNLELYPTTALTTFGGALIKCSDFRIHSFNSTDNPDFLGAIDSSNAIPVNVCNASLTVAVSGTPSITGIISSNINSSTATVDVASSTITASSTSAGITITTGFSTTVSALITAISETTDYCMDVEASIDGTIYDPIASWELIKATGTYIGSILPNSIRFIRYKQTLIGTSLSTTRTITRYTYNNPTNTGQVVNVKSAELSLATVGNTTFSFRNLQNTNFFAFAGLTANASVKLGLQFTFATNPNGVNTKWIEVGQLHFQNTNSATMPTVKDLNPSFFRFIVLEANPTAVLDYIQLISTNL